AAATCGAITAHPAESPLLKTSSIPTVVNSMIKQPTTISGTVTHTFAHRFVLETGKGPILVDLTPHSSEKIALQIGDQVALKGEMKPSELKASQITSQGKTIEIPTKHKKDH